MVVAAMSSSDATVQPWRSYSIPTRIVPGTMYGVSSMVLACVYGLGDHHHMVHISIHPTSSNSISNSISNIVNANYSVHSHLATSPCATCQWRLGAWAGGRPCPFLIEKLTLVSATELIAMQALAWTHDVACRPLI